MQLVIAFCFVVSIFALLLLPMLFHQICRRTEVEGTSTLSPSNIVQIPIEAPGLNQIESVSNPRVSDNPIESTDPRFLPPPSYEEVIATNESTEEPPPTYLESFFSQVILDSQNLQCVYRSQH